MPPSFSWPAFHFLYMWWHWLRYFLGDYFLLVENFLGFQWQNNKNPPKLTAFVLEIGHERYLPGIQAGRKPHLTFLWSLFIECGTDCRKTGSFRGISCAYSSNHLSWAPLSTLWATDFALLSKSRWRVISARWRIWWSIPEEEESLPSCFRILSLSTSHHLFLSVKCFSYHCTSNAQRTLSLRLGHLVRKFGESEPISW